MSRLIDADKLLKGIAELKQSPWFNNIYGYADRKEAVEIIEDLCIKMAPTIDAVEVVRCEDCKYSKHLKQYPKVNTWKCTLTDVVYRADDYCSYGERKNED